MGSRFKLTATEVVSLMTKSFKKAHLSYENMTGGEWLSERGVESYLTYFVAREFKNFVAKREGRVFVEVTIAQLEKYAIKGKVKLIGARGRHLQRRNRLDVLVLEKNLTPLGIIELKRERFFSAWLSDINRVERIVTRLKVPFGCFGLLLAEEKGTEHINRWITKLESYIDKKQSGLPKKIRLKKFMYKTHYREFDKSWHRIAFAGCVYTR